VQSVETHMLQVVAPEPELPAPEEPEPEEQPPASTDPYPNNFIKSVSWSGDGCPKGPEDEEPSVNAIIDEESDLSVFFFEAFAVSMGLDGVYGPKALTCSLVLDISEVPAGWRLGFADSRAEGNVYLEKGSIANFTTDIWWNDDVKDVAHNMKYWPNFDKDEPVSVKYMTTPYMLDAAGVARYASTCAASGSFGGKMTVKFSLSMEAADKTAADPRALVDMTAVGITNKLIPCG